MAAKQIYHAFINADLGGGVSSFSQTINVPFVPARVRVNYIAYYNDGTEVALSFIRSKSLLTNDASGIVGAFSDSPTPIVLGSVFELGYPVNGTFEFQVLQLNLALDGTRNGDLAIDLQFEKE